MLGTERLTRSFAKLFHVANTLFSVASILGVPVSSMLLVMTL